MSDETEHFVKWDDVGLGAEVCVLEFGKGLQPRKRILHQRSSVTLAAMGAQNSYTLDLADVANQTQPDGGNWSIAFEPEQMDRAFIEAVELFNLGHALLVHEHLNADFVASVPISIRLRLAHNHAK